MTIRTTDPSIQCQPNYNTSPDLSKFTMIPEGVHVALAPHLNTTEHHWMPGCCSPNQAQWVNSCYVWCEIPERRIESDDYLERISHSFFACMADRTPPEQVNGTTVGRRGLEGGEGDGTEGGGANAAAGRGVLGVMGWGVVGLALAGVLGF